MGVMRFQMIILLLAGFQVVRAAESPNILLIVTDEHNFRTLGCYRDHLPKEQAEMWGPGVIVQTPHIDRLAREGVICTRAYATATVCSPCRAAMITGLYPQNTGVPTNNYELRSDIPTLSGAGGRQTLLRVSRRPLLRGLLFGRCPDHGGTRNNCEVHQPRV